VSEGQLPSSFLELLDRERRYRSALRKWQQYEEWKRTRNAARAELERQHGYDTKHAMHLIRLLRMAEEIVSKGRVLVRRPDAEELRAVRRGAATSTSRRRSHCTAGEPRRERGPPRGPRSHGFSAGSG
jgi:hypothetical protein